MNPETVRLGCSRVLLDGRLVSTGLGVVTGPRVGSVRNTRGDHVGEISFLGGKYIIKLSIFLC